MKTISFKVSDDEAFNIRMQAKEENLSVSEYLRRRAISPDGPKSILRVKCDITGAEIFAPLQQRDQPRLTVEATREMLADFP